MSFVLSILSQILLQAKGGDVSTLVALFKENVNMIVGAGFTLAGLAVVKKIITNHERAKETALTYIVALVVWLCITLLV